MELKEVIVTRPKLAKTSYAHIYDVDSGTETQLDLNWCLHQAREAPAGAVVVTT